jgi:hypothetical protein
MPAADLPDNEGGRAGDDLVTDADEGFGTSGFAGRWSARLSTVEFRIYAGLAVLLLAGAFGYAIWTDWEPAGTALLFLGTGLFAIVAAYLWFSERLATSETGDDDVIVPEDEEPFLPHASIWPLEVGGGMALTFCGLAMGRWVLIPGLVLLVHGLAGWILQSHSRSLH